MRASGAGVLEAALTLNFTALSAGHAVSPEQFEPNIPVEKQAMHHEIDFTLVNVELSLGYALASWVTLEARIPYRTAHTEARFLDSDEQPIEDFESIHHRTETISGLGDIGFGARFRLLPPGLIDGLMLFGTAGVSTPTGGTRPNPFALGREGKRHQHIFFGTGTFDPYGTLAMSYMMAWGRISGFVFGRLSVYENRYGYKGRGIIYGGVDVASTFTLKSFEASAGVHVMKEYPAKWGDENAENSGRTDLMVALGVSWIASDAWRVKAGVKIPAVLDAVGGQLEIPIIAELGVSFFGDVTN